MATASTSYRLDAGLKHRLAAQANEEGITETALVTRMLEEGLRTARFPGIVFRDGPSGRRPSLNGGPDVVEVMVGVRYAVGRGEAKVRDAAEQMGLPERLIRLAIDYASAYPEEMEERIARYEAALEEAKAMAEQRARLLAS
ncbi:MAG TPA: hypothetical protein VFB94_22150 [Acidimicrobiales bacterium]|nr:hypothetical protein [Acidimicrobiales bacterium]